MKRFTLLDGWIDAVLRVGILLSALVTILYLLRVTIGVIFDENNWFWAGVLACATVPLLLTAARWLHANSPGQVRGSEAVR